MVKVVMVDCQRQQVRWKEISTPGRLIAFE